MTDIAVIGSHFRSCRHQEFILPAAGGGRAGPQTRRAGRLAAAPAGGASLIKAKVEAKVKHEGGFAPVSALTLAFVRVRAVMRARFREPHVRLSSAGC